jgi:RimJ/RimL family protein N-acetyltransferase
MRRLHHERRAMKKVLVTQRLRLRAPQPGDEHAAHAGWAQDGEVLAYLGWRARTDLAHTRAQLDWDQARWLKRSAFTWMLLESGGAPLGMVQLVAQRLDAPTHHLRLGFLLARRHWGRGLMREAVAAVVSEAFAQDKVWRVDALCDVDNHASARLLRALGFAQEGVLRRHSLHPNVSDEPRDVALFARIRAAPA